MGISSNQSGFLFKIPTGINSQEIGNKLEDFEILQNFGRGGNGFIIKVRSKKNLKIYVIKKSLEFNKALKREIILMNKLDHPNVCKCLSYFEEKGNYYIIMDLYSNKDLFRYLSAYMLIDIMIKEENLWDIFNQCLEALTYLHNKGYIHRDIKLGNIFMDDTGKVVIGDFGLCTMYNNNEYEKLSQEEKYLLRFLPVAQGTQNYYAPEIKSGNYDQKVDVYSLGVCFYCLCFHRFPLIGEYEQILYNNNYYDFELRKVIFNMISYNPDTRPNSMDVFQYFKKQYIKKYVANSSIYAIVQCLFSFPNFLKYFSDIFQISYILETEYEKQIFLALLAIKNNINDNNEIEQNAYVLRKKIIGEENKVKDNIEIPPIEAISSILNALYYELNEVPKQQNSDIKEFVFNNFEKFQKHFDDRFVSLISKNFTGAIQKTLKCQGSNCLGQKILFQKFNFVNFNLNNYANYFNQNSCVNIANIFDYSNQSFVSLKFNQRVDCNYCNRKTPHFENKIFYKLPKNLIIMFEETKINSQLKIDFEEQLSLRDTFGNYQYNLYGIITDIKYMNNMKAKYVSFIKKNNVWIFCDNHSNDNEQSFNLQQIKNYGIIVALFYYDEKREILQAMNANYNNYYGNNNFNNSFSSQQSTGSMSSTNEILNQYMWNNMFNNTIDYSNRNNSNFVWQAMNNSPMMNNNMNNNPMMNCNHMMNNNMNNNPMINSNNMMNNILNNNFNNNIGSFVNNPNNLMNNNNGFNNNFGQGMGGIMGNNMNNNNLMNQMNINEYLNG